LSLSGAFQTTDFTAAPLASGLAWDVLYSSTSVTLKVVEGITGDHNEDGTVDAADYVVWRKTDNSTAGYNDWRTNFGATLGPGGGSGSAQPAAIPEPTTMLMLLTATAIAGIPRRRTA
jgi:hypothetical protein